MKFKLISLFVIISSFLVVFFYFNKPKVVLLAQSPLDEVTDLLDGLPSDYSFDLTFYSFAMFQHYYDFLNYADTSIVFNPNDYGVLMTNNQFRYIVEDIFWVSVSSDQRLINTTFAPIFDDSLTYQSFVNDFKITLYSRFDGNEAYYYFSFDYVLYNGDNRVFYRNNLSEIGSYNYVALSFDFELFYINNSSSSFTARHIVA